MDRRTFTAREIAKLFSSQALNDELALDLGNGLVARLTASALKDPEHPSYLLELNGKDRGNLEHADDATLREVSALLWERYGDFVSSLEDDLTPDELKDKADDDGDPLTPDNLRDEPAGDPLMPDWAAEAQKREEADAAAPLAYSGNAPPGEKGE